jgi:[acyl-carrier-protein] S-malonyltransferase
MTKVALIFPGQGTQYVGMGKEFYEASPESKAIFDRADVLLGNGLRDVIFNGPAEKLTSTAFCQPAILTFCIAALRAFEAHPKYQTIQPAFVAGLSLGEYAALTASGALGFDETIKLLSRRATFMEEATKQSRGKMAAIIGMETAVIKEICSKAEAEVANFNSPAQTVITGPADKVEEACRLLKEAGAKNVVPLEVAGAFHSSLMQSAAQKFALELKRVTFKKATIPLVSNVNAQPVVDPQVMCRNLERQITSSVQWVDSVLFMAKEGVTDFIEIGPGKVLKGLLRKTDPALKVHNIEKPEDLAALPF